MESAVEQLFLYTRKFVTEREIRDFSPSDPGYGDYVKLWTKIVQTGEVPRITDFDLSEVIGLTGWADPEERDNPNRFRSYRRFTTAVGLMLVCYGNYSDDVRSANYLAHDLLIDLNPHDAIYKALAKKVCWEMRDLLKTDPGEDEFPYFTFAAMILAQWDEDWSESEKAASLLLEDESTVRHNGSLGVYDTQTGFLLGLTYFDQLHQDWRRWAGELRNPTDHEDTQLIIESFS